MIPSWQYENRLWRQGYILVAGVDEVGRGAWAGPILAGAVVVSKSDIAKFKNQPWFKRVADSKLLTPKTREEIFLSCAKQVCWSIGSVNNKVIDKIGIAEANRRAVYLAVNNLSKKPDFVLVDYVAKLGDKAAGIKTKTLVDGDAKVFSIALASIIAKVERDQLMEAYDKTYPDYGFAEHKGYGTKKHLKALIKNGPCAIHRQTYRPVKQHLL